jgi:ubiquinone/menaquinone biosynthesis C-methylase UbiE
MVRAARWVCTSAPYGLLASRAVLPWAMRGVRLDGQVLEIGCGSGAMAARILRQHRGVALVVTDLDAGMIAAARTRLAAFGGRVTAEYADAADLPFDDGSFDVVLSFAMLHHVGNWEHAVAEALRVLRPGGRFVGYDALNGPLVRLLHWGEGENVRLLRHGEIEKQLTALSVRERRTHNARTGLVVRFCAVKGAPVVG